MHIVVIDNYICILTFVDIIIKLGVATDAILYTGIPKAKYITSTMLNGAEEGRWQKISTAPGYTNLYNYWTTDNMRKKNNGVSDGFHGQLIYIIDNS